MPVDLLNIATDLIVKAGDDLRQDQICYLCGSIMNSCWQVASPALSLKLCLYQCIELGDHCGVIEVVPRSTGLIEVQHSSMEGAMNKGSLRHWLKKHRARDVSWDEVCLTPLTAARLFV